MSFKALAAIADVDAPNAAVVALLYTLAQYADEDGVCFPSRATLSQGTKLSMGGLRNAILAAQAAGLIEVDERLRKDGGRSSNRFTLLFCAPKKAKITPSDESLPEALPTPTPLSSGERGGCHEVRGPLSPGDRAFLNQSPEPEEAKASNNGAGSPEVDGFEVLLAAWAARAPGRTSRVRAWPAWRWASQRGDPAAILGAGLRYLAEDPDVKRGRTLAMDRWLTEQCWEPWLVGTSAEPARPGPRVAGRMADEADQQAWASVTAVMRRELGEGTFGSYLGSACLGADDKGPIVVAATGTGRDWITKHAWARIEALWAGTAAEGRSLRLQSKQQFEAGR